MRYTLALFLLYSSLATAQESPLAKVGVAYTLSAEESTALLAELVLIGGLKNENQSLVSSILLSVLPVSKPSAIDCASFRERLGQAYVEFETDMLREFLCEDSTLSLDRALAQFGTYLQYPVDTDEKVDAHWAWYAATGNEQALRNLLDTYLNSNEACLNCIAWSFGSNFKANPDVRNFYSNYLSEKSSTDKAKLLLMPGLESTP